MRFFYFHGNFNSDFLFYFISFFSYSSFPIFSHISCFSKDWLAFQMYFFISICLQQILKLGGIISKLSAWFSMGVFERVCARQIPFFYVVLHFRFNKLIFYSFLFFFFFSLLLTRYISSVRVNPFPSILLTLIGSVSYQSNRHIHIHT